MCKTCARLPRNPARLARGAGYLAGMNAICMDAHIRFAPSGGPQLPGIHAVVIALLCHPLTGGLIRLMGALGFGGWATTYLL